MQGINLSIIILSYNTRELLEQCLESVVRCWRLGNGRSTITHHPSPITQIIVVDNGSTDGSVEYINELTRLRINGLTIKKILNKENLGFAKGNNLGLKMALGKYILFLNSDTEIYPNALNEAIEFMESDPKIGAMTPKTLLFSGGMDPDCHRGFPTPWASISYFLGLEKLFPKSKLFGQYHKFYLNLNENHEIDAGAGAFMVVRKEVIDKVGGWDEKYFFYGEDLDFYYRIKKAGYKVMFYAKPLILHHKGGSSGIRKESKNITQATKETRLKVARESIKAMEIFYEKFYKNKYPTWLTAMVLSGIKVKGWFRVTKQYLT